MTTPLYCNHDKPVKCEGNHGLWFERFYDQYDPRGWDVLKPTANNTKMGNSHWLLTHFNKKVGDAGTLERHVQMQMTLAESLYGQSHVFKASGHFVTGMGNPHPVENGFAWHPTLGVPYLTGAAVKGLVRSYIETHLDESDASNPDKKQLLLDWFGSTDKDPVSQGYQSQAGELIFFDALPTEPVALGVDVMTPHMGKWYEKGGDEREAGKYDAVPADWHGPVPVSFLVAKDITLLFSFALRPYTTDSKRPAVDFADVELALTNVLEQMGAGGKTSTGYGGMVDPEKQEQERKALQEAASLAAAERIEGYLKINSRNQSLYLERSGQKLAFATGGKPAELLRTLPEASVKSMKPGKGVKVYAYVARQEILKVEIYQ